MSDADEGCLQGVLVQRRHLLMLLCAAAAAGC
jgi:hypothetical protein